MRQGEFCGDNLAERRLGETDQAVGGRVLADDVRGEEPGLLNSRASPRDSAKRVQSWVENQARRSHDPEAKMQNRKLRFGVKERT